MPEFDAMVRSRITALIAKSGRSINNVAVGIGWSESTLHRKLETGDKSRRRLNSEDIDLIMAELGEPLDRIMKPVLLEGDAAALGWLDIHIADSNDAVLACGVGVIARLNNQGLIELDEKEVWQVTSAGRRLKK